jgi:ribosomal protein L11 methyltransferase
LAVLYEQDMDDKWTEIVVVTSKEAANVISNRLIELGSQGTVFEDHPDETTACLVKAYYPQSVSADELVEQLQRYLNELEQLGVNIGNGEILSKWIENIDWSSNWKQYFKAVRVGKHLVIKPPWETFDRCSSDIVIDIEPGMAFGTGLHSSTRLALALLERYLRKGDNILDIGVGSGILSIAAARLGADYVLGVDIDTEAVAIARENVQRNISGSDRDPSIHNRIELLIGSIDTLPISRQFDCIMMNLRPNIIIPLIPYVKAFLQTGGAIITSGILEEEGPEMVHSVRFFDLIVQNHLIEDGWIAYVLSEMYGESRGICGA